ncbi:MAG: VCBS repeat-containing protein [Patescibacteria group bacterium]
MYNEASFLTGIVMTRAKEIFVASFSVVGIIGVIAVLVISSTLKEREEAEAKKRTAILKDVNGDSLPDIMITDRNYGELILFGRPDGTFKSLETILHEADRSMENTQESAKQELENLKKEILEKYKKR